MSRSTGLADKNALIVGVGLRGSAVAALLAVAGVGRLGLIDGAQVEEADAGSHPFQFTPDVLQSKPEALAAKLALINPDVHAEPFPAFVDQQNAELILAGADVVVDCADRREARLLVNDAAVELKVPLVTGSSSSVIVVLPGDEVCLRCAEGFDPSEATDPAHASIVAATQAAAAIELLSGREPRIHGELAKFDPAALRWSYEPLVCTPGCSCAHG